MNNTIQAGLRVSTAIVTTGLSGFVSSRIQLLESYNHHLYLSVSVASLCLAGFALTIVVWNVTHLLMDE